MKYKKTILMILALLIIFILSIISAFSYNNVAVEQKQPCDNMNDNSNYYYCGIEGQWHIDNQDRYRSYVPNGTTSITEFGCCYIDECWTGYNCTNSVTPETATEGDALSGNYFCIDGQWQKLSKRYLWTLDESGYCYDSSSNKQCYLNSADYHCVDQYAIADDDRTINSNGNHFCYNGVWLSRTMYAGLALDYLADTENLADYSVYCDSKDKVGITSFRDEIEYACILFGHKNNLEKRYVSMLIDNETILEVLDGLGVASCNYYGITQDVFVECDDNVWYNPVSNILIYSQDDYTPRTTSWFGTDVYIAVKRAYDKIISLFRNRPDKTLIIDINKVFDSNKLYYFSKGSKKIVAYVEENKLPEGLLQDVSNMVVKYDGFTIDGCKYLSKYKQYSVLDVPECFDISGGFVLASIKSSANFNIDSYWNDITTKIRG